MKVLFVSKKNSSQFTVPLIHTRQGFSKGIFTSIYCPICFKLILIFNYEFQDRLHFKCNRHPPCADDTTEFLYVLLRNCTNVLEAASNGATSSVSLVAALIVNIISFLSLLSFFDAVLSWLGEMFGCPELSFAVMSPPDTDNLPNLL